MSKWVVAAMVGSTKIPQGPLRALLTNLHKIELQILMIQRRIASSQVAFRRKAFHFGQTLVAVF
jgi:hypothetical protein